MWHSSSPAFRGMLGANTAPAAHCNKDKGRITQVVIPRKDFTALQKRTD